MIPSERFAKPPVWLIYANAAIALGWLLGAVLHHNGEDALVGVLWAGLALAWYWRWRAATGPTPIQRQRYALGYGIGCCGALAALGAWNVVVLGQAVPLMIGLTGFGTIGVVMGTVFLGKLR